MPSMEVVRLPCACANLRRAARVVTQFYDGVLRPTRLRVTQFTLLQALNRAPGIYQSRLAELLGMDSTTLTGSDGFALRKPPTGASFSFFSRPLDYGNTSAWFPAGSRPRGAYAGRWVKRIGIGY